jgi:peptide/nickel transport system permease protein
MNKNLLIKALANPLSKAGFIIIVAVFLLAMFAPIIAPYDPDDINVKA